MGQEPPAVALAASPSAEAECPHCGAGLQRAEPGADGRILCLNCGKRFAPAGAERQASPDAAERASEPVPPVYGYLRAAGILAFLTGLAGLAMAGYEPFKRLIEWDLSTGTGLSCLSSVFCFLAGAMVLRTIWDLLRLDGLHGALVWRRGLLTSPLAPLRGTSLLYILPPASLGGMLGLYLMADGLNTEDGFRVGAGVVVIAAGLLAAFGAENLRLLLWRQVQWAARLRGLNDLPPSRAWNGSTLLWLPLLVGLLLMVAMILDRARRGAGGLNFRWSMIWLGGLFAVGLAALLLLRNLAASMRAWHAAGENLHRRDPLLMAMAYMPLLFCVSGSAWILLCLNQMLIYMDAEFLFMLSGVCLVSGSLALFMGRLAIELARWRRAQERLLETPPGSFWKGVNGHLAFWLLFTGLVGGVTYSFESVLHIINLSTFAATWTDLLRTMTSDFCAALIIFYIPLWCLAILRETRLSVAAAEQALARAHEPRTLV